MPLYPPAVAAVSSGVSAALNAVTDFGATGNGTTDDSTALDNAINAARTQKKALYLPTGRYMRNTTWDLRGDNVHVFGDGPENSVILEGMGNAPTIQVGGYYQWIHDIGTELASTKGANSNTIEVMDCAYSVYERLVLLGPGRGIYQPQVNADGLGGNAMWSCRFDTIRISGPTVSAIDLQSFNSANTGSIFNNIYIGSLTSDSTPTGVMVRLVSCDEIIINQLNIEHCVLPDHAIYIERGNATINGLHFEGVTLNGSGKAFISLVNQCHLNLNSCTIGGNTYPSGSGDKSFLSYDINPSYARVHGLYCSGNTLSATNRYLVRMVDSTSTAGSSVEITGAKLGSDFTALSNGDSTTIPQLKRVNADVYHYTEGGKNVTFGTAAPTTGTWAVGDKRWNSAPAAGGTPGWLCTTAGTPGTWKAMASVAA